MLTHKRQLVYCPVAVKTNVFRALADPTRRELLDSLLSNEKSASELCGRFSATQQAISLHLQQLRGAGLVEVRKEGRFRRYRLKAQPIREIYEWTLKYKPFFDSSGHAWSFSPTPDGKRPESAMRPKPRRKGRRT